MQISIGILYDVERVALLKGHEKALHTAASGHIGQEVMNAMEHKRYVHRLYLEPSYVSVGGLLHRLVVAHEECQMTDF